MEFLEKFKFDNEFEKTVNGMNVALQKRSLVFFRLLVFTQSAFKVSYPNRRTKNALSLRKLIYSFGKIQSALELPSCLLL